MKKIKDMSNKELKHEWESVNESIEKVDCYGIGDLQWRDVLEAEIAKRGGEVETSSEVNFERVEEE